MPCKDHDACIVVGSLKNSVLQILDSSSLWSTGAPQCSSRFCICELHFVDRYLEELNGGPSWSLFWLWRSNVLVEQKIRESQGLICSINYSVPHRLSSDLWITTSPQIGNLSRPFRKALCFGVAKDVHKLVVMVQISGSLDLVKRPPKTKLFMGKISLSWSEVKSGFWREFMKEPTVKAGFTLTVGQMNHIPKVVVMLKDFGMLNVDSSLCCEKMGFLWGMATRVFNRNESWEWLYNWQLTRDYNSFLHQNL